MNGNRILQSLGNETRLQILRLLLKEDSYVEKLACELSLTPATICYHLKKMENVGLVCCSRTQFYIIYSLNREIFNLPLKSFLEIPEKQKPNQDERYYNQVIASFFQQGRLTHIPSQQKKREIVLREILKSFDINKTYSEQEANEIIHQFHPDHCTIRRWMVMYGMLNREHNTYWVAK